MREFMAEKLKVRVFDTRAQMGEAAGRDAAEQIRQIIAEKGRANVVFASAPSQNEMLSTLRSEGVDWSKVYAFHMDEYIGLAADAPQRFAAFVQSALWNDLPFAATYPLGMSGDAAAECERYAALLRDNPPDLILAGIGENGHLAFNDPWVADFDDPVDVKVVELDEVCRTQQVNDGTFPTVQDVPKTALTLTLPVFARAPSIIATVPAPSKAGAVWHAVNSPITVDHPCTLLRRHANATLYLDRDSAGRLEI